MTAASQLSVEALEFLLEYIAYISITIDACTHILYAVCMHIYTSMFIPTYMSRAILAAGYEARRLQIPLRTARSRRDLGLELPRWYVYLHIHIYMYVYVYIYVYIYICMCTSLTRIYIQVGMCVHIPL